MINNILTPQEEEKRGRLRLVKPDVYRKVIRYNEKLSKGESIAIIQLQYSYACPFHCSHCSVSTFRNIKGREKFNPERVKDLCVQADELGLAHLDLTGGDTLAFKELDQIIEAINPNKFYIQCDTNGWLMTGDKAKHLKDIGVDKIQLSIDSLNADEHDMFRNKKGSYKSAIWSIDYIKNAGLNLQIASVVTHQRVRTPELIRFLDYMKERNVSVSVVYPKLVGEWEGRYDLMITSEDIKYIHDLSERYDVYDHTSKKYGRDIGCIAVKRMISVNAYGDVMPCPWLYFSLGNVFTTPLKDILEKGMKYFGKPQSKCLVSESKEFNDKYISKTYNREVPVPIEEIMSNGGYDIEN